MQKLNYDKLKKIVDKQGETEKVTYVIKQKFFDKNTGAENIIEQKVDVTQITSRIEILKEEIVKLQALESAINNDTVDETKILEKEKVSK